MQKLSYQIIVTIFFVLVMFVADANAASKVDCTKDIFKWTKLSSLEREVEGSFIGASYDVLIIAGGIKSTTDANKMEYTDLVSVLSQDQNEWQDAFKLDHPCAFGATISTSHGVILIGGTDGVRVYSDVIELRWDKIEKKLKTIKLPNLPVPCAYGSAILLDNTLYVAGGKSSLQSQEVLNTFWSLDISHEPFSHNWKQLPTWPGGTGRMLPALGVQNNGERDCVYMFCGKHYEAQDKGIVVDLKDGYQYNAYEKDALKRWKKLVDVDKSFSGSSIIQLGSSHLLVFPQSPSWFGDIQPVAYHTITNTWTSMGQLPENFVISSALNWQDKITILGTCSDKQQLQIFQSSLNYKIQGFGFINYLTLAVYFLALVLVGVYFSKKQKDTNQFFLGGKRIPWWAAGLSIYGAGFSAISFMGITAKAYLTNWTYIFASVSLIPIMIFTIYLFIPFFCNLQITTAYEYLEKRFNLSVRLFGSVVFIIFLIARMAIMLLFPAIALSTVTGLSVSFCVLSMGLFCIIYTMLGGIEAVIWNDCLQVIVFLGGAVSVLIIALVKVDVGFFTSLSEAFGESKFQMVDLSWDYTIACMWVVIIGNMLSNIPAYISDQSIVQKYLTTSDIKQSRQSLWLNIWMIVPSSAIFFMMGTALYIFYKNNPEMLHPAIKNDAILPWFVMQNLPEGLGGFVIAGVFAASMSSLDSSLHAVSTAIITDFYGRLNPKVTESQHMHIARILILTLGLVAIISAALITYFNVPSLLDLFMTLLGLISGGIAGIFLLGILTTRTHGIGAFLGALTSCVLVFLAQTQTKMHFFLYGAVGLLSAMFFGYVFSLLIPCRGQDLTGLTIHTGRKQPEVVSNACRVQV